MRLIKYLLVLIPTISFAGPYYELNIDTTTGTALMRVSGNIGIAASSNTPTNYVIKLDGVNSRVGIGTINPSYKLDVNGSINATTYYKNGVELSGGDAVLSATQTWTGQNKYQNNSVFNSSITINANSSQQYALTIDTNNNTSDGYALSVSITGEIANNTNNLCQPIAYRNFADQTSVSFSFDSYKAIKIMYSLHIDNVSYAYLYINGLTSNYNISGARQNYSSGTWYVYGGNGNFPITSNVDNSVANSEIYGSGFFGYSYQNNRVGGWTKTTATNSSGSWGDYLTNGWVSANPISSLTFATSAGTFDGYIYIEGCFK